MKWTCSVCGYTYEGPEPPEKCPQCGVPDVYKRQGFEKLFRKFFIPALSLSLYRHEKENSELICSVYRDLHPTYPPCTPD